MEVHKYQVLCYVSAFHKSHGWGMIQDRLYIPNQGVLGITRRLFITDQRRVVGRKQISFFNDSQEAIKDAESIINGMLIKDVKYLGQIELPDEAIEEIVSAGKALSQAKISFEEAGKTLADLIK